MVAVDAKAACPNGRCERGALQHVHVVDRAVVRRRAVVLQLARPLGGKVLPERPAAEHVDELDAATNAQDGLVVFYGLGKECLFKGIAARAGLAGGYGVGLGGAFGRSFVQRRVHVMPARHEQAVAAQKHVQRILRRDIQRQDHRRGPRGIHPVEVPRQHPDALLLVVPQRHDTNQLLHNALPK